MPAFAVLLAVIGCRTPGGSAAVDEGPGVYRLGPPAPSVGAYGVAAPGNGKVYVSNLHVPFITVADADTGAWSDAIDLRDGCSDHSFFPRLYVTGSTLWVTQIDEQRLCRYDLDAGEWLDGVDAPGLGAVAADHADLWISTPDALLRHDGTGWVESVPAPAWASALAVSDGTFALVVAPEERVILLDRGGTLWDGRVDAPELNDVAIAGSAAIVTDRASGDLLRVEDGAEVARVHTGSDTFAVQRMGDVLYVTNRQGAELPESGAYEGDPALVSAWTAQLEPVWSTPLSKTVHFLAYDGSRLWTANEDALRLSALDPVTGAEVVRGPPIGLTVDHLADVGDAIVFGSHLTDEVWRVSLTGEARSADACGWPFLGVPTDEGLVVPCQEDGRVWTLDPDTLDPLDEQQVSETFFPACVGGLCTGHDTLIAAASTEDGVVYSDPHDGAIRWTDGRELVIGQPELPGDLHHFDVAGLGDTVLAYEPRAATVYAVRGGAVAGSLPIADETAAFPFAPDGDRVWVGSTAVDATLATVATLPEGAVAQVAGEGWIVAVQVDDLVVYDASLAERGRLALEDLRVPPWRGIDGGWDPLRFRVADGQLLVGNTMHGTIERRALPDLRACGDDEPLPLGRWEEFEGIR